jgi:hypothetical protein
MRKGEKSEGERKGGMKNLSFTWVQASKKRCSIVVLLSVSSRGRHNEGGWWQI